MRRKQEFGYFLVPNITFEPLKNIEKKKNFQKENVFNIN